MDIKQLEYFITIVDSNLNLSEAAGRIHISQSALSQMIKNFEKKENTILFERKHSRLDSLTLAGKLLYKHSAIITKQYENMLFEIRNLDAELKGEIRIGIPPFIISTIFSQIISLLKCEYPDIKMTILEFGAYQLKKMLIAKEVDIAILLKPHELDLHLIEEIHLVENELCAFVHDMHDFVIKKSLAWSELNQAPLAIFDQTYMIHHQLMTEFKKQKIEPNILIQSNYWDFLLRSILGTDIITILPTVTFDYFPAPYIKAIPFNEPIKWKVVMCRNKKETHSNVAEFVFGKIKEHFE